MVIADMFISKYNFLQSNFCFLVGDRDVGTVAPDLIIQMIMMMSTPAGQSDDHDA